MIRRLLLFFFSHRLLAIARWDFHFLRVRFRNVVRLSNRKTERFLNGRNRPTFLNLGCGPRGLDNSHWVNVDAFTYENVHFLLDINRPLPFIDGSFDGVFCEHVLEHFSVAEGERLLHDVKRVLRKLGVIRIVVPDGERLVKAYSENPHELAARRDAGTDTPMEILNMYFRQRYEHQFIYDWDTLHNTLHRVGFTTVKLSSFRGCTLSDRLVLDDPKYAWESLYVEAQK